MQGDRHPNVLAVIKDMECRAHVLAALEKCSNPTFVEDVAALLTIGSHAIPDILIWHLDALMGVVEMYMSVFERFRRAAPHCVVMAYVDMGRASAPRFLAAARVGVDRIVIRGFDDLAMSVQSALGSGAIEGAIRRLLQALALPPGPAAFTLAHCLRRATEGPLTVRRLAKELEVNRKTIGHWLRRAHLPTPERLIGWARVHAVALVLANPRKSVAHAARVLRFSSESDLRRMVSRYARCTPTELRQCGGAAMVVSRMCRQRLDAARTEH